MRPFLSSLTKWLRSSPPQISVQEACMQNAKAEQRFERAIEDWTASKFDEVIGAFVDDNKRPNRGD